MKENFHVRFGERGGETRRPQGRKVRSAPTLRSGNFLYLALSSLLDLWKEVYNLMLALGLTPISPLAGISPTPGQLHGIEINPYAYELAQATIWIGYIQWLRDNGFGLPSEPILRSIQTVQRMDAIMAGGGIRGVRGQGAGMAGGGRDHRQPAVFGRRQDSRRVGRCVHRGPVQTLRRPARRNFSDLCCYWFERGAGTDRIREGETSRTLGDSGDSRRRESQGIGTNKGDRRHFLGAIRS